jgi:hypothetical protein
MSIEEQKSLLKEYFFDHGFDVNSTSKELFGFLETFTESDYFKSSGTVGLVCYSIP